MQEVLDGNRRSSSPLVIWEKENTYTFVWHSTEVCYVRSRKCGRRPSRVAIALVSRGVLLRAPRSRLFFLALHDWLWKQSNCEQCTQFISRKEESQKRDTSQRCYNIWQCMVVVHFARTKGTASYLKQTKRRVESFLNDLLQEFFEHAVLVNTSFRKTLRRQIVSRTRFILWGTRRLNDSPFRSTHVVRLSVTWQSVDRTPKVWPLKWKLLHRTFSWCCLLCCARRF